MTADHASEPLLDGDIERATRRAARGEVVYVSDTVAIVPAAVAAAGEAAIRALEDVEDLRALRAARSEGGEPIPDDQVWAELGL